MTATTFVVTGMKVPLRFLKSLTATLPRPPEVISPRTKTVVRDFVMEIVVRVAIRASVGGGGSGGGGGRGGGGGSGGGGGGGGTGTLAVVN